LPVDETALAPVAPLLQERIRTLDEAVEMAGFFFRDQFEIDAAKLTIEGHPPAESADLLRRAHDAAAAVSSWRAEEIERPLRSLAEQAGLTAGQLFGPIRLAITGQAVSPPLFETMEIVGRERCLERIMSAVDALRRSTTA
jgi:glutamyl-tRNA synthetase